jgi:hypothetical protein
MRDLNELFTRCCEELDVIGVPYAKGKIDGVYSNSRYTRRYGNCRRLPNGHFEISIASFLLSDKITSDKIVRNTIFHELTHTCPDCFNHGKKFHEWGALISDCYDVDISTYVSKEISNTVNEAGVIKKPKNKYEVVCCGCGAKSYFKRKTNTVKIINGEIKGKVTCRCCHSNDFIVNNL